MRTVIKIVLTLVVVIGLASYFFLDKFADGLKPTHRQVELVSSNNKSALYIKTENWGVTGDSQRTIITTDNGDDFEVDSTRQIIFDGLEPFLYRQNNDTLVLYVWTKATIPKDFKSPWTIIQIEVDNLKMMDLRRDNSYKGV